MQRAKSAYSVADPLVVRLAEERAIPVREAQAYQKNYIHLRDSHRQVTLALLKHVLEEKEFVFAEEVWLGLIAGLQEPLSLADFMTVCGVPVAVIYPILSFIL